MHEDIKRWRRLRLNAEYSTAILEQAIQLLGQQDFADVSTIAVAGSFGRDEASECSDADFIVILSDQLNDDTRLEVETTVWRTVADKFESLGVERPNPSGVFARARTLDELLPPQRDGGIGLPDEATDIMGKRLLLLLESKPIWGPEGYKTAIDQIFDRYVRDVRAEPRKEFVLLLNDLIRYFRYICVNYESSFGSQRDKWALRNLKLRHSRLLMYFGLLVLLGEASTFRDDSKIDFLRSGLNRTPLERAALAYDRADDSKFGLLTGLYANFLEGISDPTLRTVLSSVDFADRYDNLEFARLKANSDAFQTELTRFCFAQRGRWSERFFEYLLF